jgi:hypothetical protein
MAKVSTRIPLHANKPDKFIQLMKDLVEKHEAMGASSPLTNNTMVDMAAFKQKLLQADALRNESIKARAEAESKMNQAKEILGTANGQTINTDHTLYYDLDLLKKYLVFKFSGALEQMSEFGFEVVVANAKGIGRPKKKKA